MRKAKGYLRLRATVLLAALLPSAAVVAASTTVSIGTSSSGSLYNILAVGIADIVSRNTDLSASAITTGGADATLRAIGDGKTDLGIVHTWALRRAYVGEDPFRKPIDARVVVQGQPTGVYLIARADAGIRTPADLKGKTLVGKRPALRSIDEFTETLLDVYALESGDVNVVQTAESGESVRALTQGTVDAIVLPGGIATPQIKNLAETVDITFPKIDRMQQILEHPNTTRGAFLMVNPEGTYKGQDGKLAVLGYGTVLVAAGRVPEDVVYKVTRALMENRDALKEVHREGAAWTLENTMKAKLSVPFHAGAVRYFKEKGVWTDEHQKRQDEME